MSTTCFGLKEFWNVLQLVDQMTSLVSHALCYLWPLDCMNQMKTMNRSKQESRGGQEKMCLITKQFVAVVIHPFGRVDFYTGSPL